MIMRYHWGLAVGHVYTHGRTAALIISSTETQPPSSSTVECDVEEEIESADPGPPHLRLNYESGSDDLDFGFENRQDDDLDDDDLDGDLDDVDVFSDDELIAMDGTYGF